MKVLVYTSPDGAFNVVSFASANRLPGESEDQLIARKRAKSTPAGATNVRIIDRTEIPVDRTFRSALRDQGGRFTHDMDESRKIAKTKLKDRGIPDDPQIDNAPNMNALKAILKRYE